MAIHCWRQSSWRLRTFRCFLFISILSLIIPNVFPQSLPTNLTDFIELTDYDLPEDEEVEDTPEEPDYPPGSTSLTFVFDTTGSMHDDLMKVQDGATRILETTTSNADTPLYNFVLVPFHDPRVGPVTETQDQDLFLSQLNDIYVHGGGDCPEMSVSAIKVALELSLPGSQIYVFTDARAKDYNKTKDVLKLIQDKESQVVFVLTGDCNNSAHEGYTAYEQIAATSSGQVFHLNKSDVEEVLKFVELSVQTRKVHLISTDMSQGAVQYHWLPVDTRLRQFIISLSGDNPNIMLRAPNGDVIPVVPNSPENPPTGPYLEELLTLGKAYIVAIRNSTPGVYRLNVSSTSSSTLRVQGISLLDFKFGFSRDMTTNLNHTSRLPLRGVRSQLLISADQLLPRGYLKKVEFLNLQGHIIPGHEYTLEPDPTQDGIYTVADIIPPGDYFHIRVKGIDHQNYNFQRITAAAVSPLVPAAPLPRMAARTPGFFGKMATLRCFVDSMLPFTVEWRKGEEVIGMTDQFSESSLVEYDVGNAHSQVEGIYSCIAHSRDMEKPLMGRADTFLDVTEPPPRILPPSNVTTVPGLDAILTCDISSTVPYNVTWDRPGSSHSLRLNTRVHLLRSGSLIIRDVRQEDTGRFRCIARNEGGYSFDYVPLLIQEPPEAFAAQPNVTFMAWDNTTLTCTATGIPTPRITWTKDGLPLPDDSRVVDSGDGRLFLRSMTPSLAGIYTCHAINDAGASEIPIYVSYSEVPYITRGENEYLVAPDQRATLHCRATGSPPPKIMWFKNNMDLSTSHYTEVTEEGDLIIMSAHVYDQGEYMCVAANEAGSDSMPVNLFVGAEPEIILAPSRNTGDDYGQNVTLPCLAQGYPKPTIRWEKVGAEGFLTESSRMDVLPNGYLVIHELAVDDRGTYICHAENAFGVDTAVTQLRVTGLVQPSISAVSPREIVTASDKVSLLCEVVMGNPPPSIEWYRDGSPMDFEVGRHRLEEGRLVIESVLVSDGGRYTCIATNEVGNASVTTQLIVQVPPIILEDVKQSYTVIETKSVQLNCPAEGFPRPQIQWLFNGEPISNNGLDHFVNDQGSLSIPFAASENGGTYTCKVVNPAGQVSLDIALHVLVPPSIDGPDSSISLNTTEFNPVTLPCVVRSNPPSEIRWTRNGEPVPFSGRNYYQSSSGSLIFQRVEESDRGYYVCIATNQAGNTTKIVELEVHVVPRIREADDEASVIVGEMLSLECNAYGNPAPEISWQKDGTKVKFHKRRFVKEDSGTFTIRNARPGDQGTYTCLATNDAGADRRVVRVSVFIAPNITDSFQSYNVLVDRDVMLYCDVTGFPDPEIEWFINNEAISPNNIKYSIDESTGSLEILSLSVEDTAIYECRASNPAGLATGEFEINVVEPPKVTNGTIEIVKVMMGDTADMSCEIHSTPPPEISWEVENQPISVSSSALVLPDNTLRLSRTRPSDAGYYTCIATNIVGTATKMYQLVVLVPPTIVPGEEQQTAYVEEAVRLSCEHDGFPQPTVMWMKGEEKVNTQNRLKYFLSPDGSLTIYGLQDQDSSEYTCNVGNEAGIASITTELTVLMPPQIMETPSDYTVLYRNSVTLHCEADGIPPPKTVWTKDGVPLTEDDVRYFANPSGSLRIASAVRSDTGTYSCLITNSAGTARKDINLNVLVPPEFDNEAENEYKVLLKQDISLPCGVDSYPPPTITWYKDGHQLSFTTPRILMMSDSLDIPRAQVSDSGLYRCVATHPAGNISRNFRVNVQVPPRIGDSPTTIRSLVGDNIVLPCEAVGVPIPVVMWSRGGEKYPAQDERFEQLQQGSLSIRNAKEGDSGKYLCIAVSEAGSESKTLWLEVNDPPRITNYLPSELVQPLNSFLMIPCEAEGSPRPNVEWFKGSTPVKQFQNGYTITTDGSLIISSLQPGDNGVYTCRVSNQWGNDSQSTSVDTQVRPHIVGENTEREAETLTAMQGDTIQLECNVTDAHPPATISWYMDDRLITNPENAGLEVDFGGRLLTIPFIQNQDMAHYYCIASNSVGDTQKHFRVNVQEGPIINSLAWEEVTVMAGQDVSFDCNVRGTPLPRISWHFDDIPLASTNQRYNFHLDGSIDLRRVEVIDTGFYTCLAKNRAGTANRTIVLTVEVPPSINPSKDHFALPEGTDVILPCEADGVPIPEVTWEKDGIPLDMEGAQYQQLFLGSLRISPVQAMDAGEYVCTARNEAGEASKTVTLRVHIPPSVVPTIPRMTTARVNEDVILTCPITGTPEPIYRWKRNNHNLRLNSRRYRTMEDGRLMIIGATLMDNGEYVCVARNQAGVKSVGVNLQVTSEPQITGTQESEDYPVLEFESINLQCFMEDAYPPPTIEWYFQGRIVSENNFDFTLSNNRQVLEIESATAEDAGQYYCLVSNAVGSSRRVWNVDVLVSPTIRNGAPQTIEVLQSQYVSFPCVAEGNPRPTTTWLKDGQELQPRDGRHLISSDGTLVITMAHSEDTGVYTCQTSNLAGEDTKTVTLEVLVPPSITQGPDTIFVTAGLPAFLHCETSGFPAPDISWERNYRVVAVNSHSFHQFDNGTLMINSSRPLDSGEYICVAESRAGTAYSQTNLIVNELPLIHLPPMNEQEVINGEDLVLHCPVSGTPLPTILWLKDDEVVDPTVVQMYDNGTILIPGAEPSDSGNYTCFVTNMAGNDSVMTAVYVYVTPRIMQQENAFEINILLGEAVSLICQVEEGTPFPRISWFKGGTRLSGNSLDVTIDNRGQRLSISQAQLANTGRYKCVAENAAGSAQRFFGILVMSKPSIGNVPSTISSQEASELRVSYNLVRSEPLTLNCDAHSTPPPIITWLKDGRVLIPGNSWPNVTIDGQYLHVNSVDAEHSGEYTCVAMNEAGNATRSFLVDVLMPPDVEGSEITHNMTAIQKEPFEMVCETDESIPAKIAWYHNGRKLRKYDQGRSISKTGTVLTLQNPQREDRGDYYCEVSNQAGSERKHFSVDIYVPGYTTSENTELSVLTGASVPLECHGFGYPEPTVSWTKDGAEITLTNDRYALLSDGTLIIPEITVSDGGLYECTVSNVAGRQSYSVTIEVQVPPTIITSITKITTIINSTSQIPCVAVGTPKPIITWRKDRRMVDVTDGYAIQESGTLLIRSTQLYDSGRYACVAQNEAGHDAMELTLEVHVPPMVTPVLETYSVVEDTAVTLECRATGTPEPQIRWYFGDLQLASSSHQYHILYNGGLQIPIVRREDTGSFTCVASNPAGEDSGLRFLEVTVPPMILPRPSTVSVDATEDLHLVCDVDGIPLPTIMWHKDGELIRGEPRMSFNEDGSLTIASSVASDAGTYLCVATSSEGRDSMQIEVTVNVPPTITYSPADKEVASGDRLEVTCEASGFPDPEFRWFHNRTEIRSPPTINGRSTLIRENVMKEDSGLYRCRAENVAGQQSMIFTLLVRVPPQIVDPPAPVEALVGNTVEMRCAIEGEPLPEVSWSKNDETVILNDRVALMQNGSLMIHNTLPQDSGAYKCLAYNRYGMTISAEAMLSIKSAPSIVVGPMNTTIDKGEMVLLDCMVTGNPAPVVRWRKGSYDILLTSGVTIFSNNSLLIVTSRRQDTGAYICEAFNVKGRAEATAYLTVRVHGAWSRWTDWEQCDATCGAGLERRHRFCNNPEPANGGRQCSGPSTDSRSCELAMCPIDGAYSDWAEWGPCSVTCGSGEKFRHRSCNNPPPQYGGRPCIGLNTSRAGCNLAPCPEDGQWGQWHAWRPCSKTCGEGVQQRVRRCDSPAPRHGGQACEGFGFEERMCRHTECPVNGGFSQWSDWSTCSSSCGGGIKTRTRTCSSPAPAFGGANCLGQTRDRLVCMPEPCPIHGSWSDWGPWSICSATCDGGFQERYRSCNNPEPHHNGRQCPGRSREQRTCNHDRPCSTDGNWGAWSSWSECSATCGESISRRNRTCNNPTPRNNGQQCVGDSDLIRRCDVPDCMVGPQRVFARVIGNLNGVLFGDGIMMVNISNEQDGNTRVVARVHNIPNSAVYAFQSLMSLLSPAYWTSAFEVNGAFNGYTLTDGMYTSAQEVSFASGEKVKMTISSTGVDRNGTLQVHIVVDGETPEFTSQDDIQVLNHKESFIQIGRGKLYGYTSKMILVNNQALPVAWNATINYQNERRMPYLVQSVSNEPFQMDYHVGEQAIRYGLRVYVSKGNPSNQCPAGFTLDLSGPYCRDVDECENGACSHGCSNYPGGYVCTCPSGWKRALDQENCIDINECTIVQGICSQQCVNTHGSYRCECTRGYRLEGESTCLDVNECAENVHNCRPNQICRNTRGHYSCFNNCQTGFDAARNGSCVDIDECRLGTHNCIGRQRCQNIQGGYQCLCPQGYRPEHKRCVDINECLQHPCLDLCINTEGDYECQCPAGYSLLSDRKSCTRREPYQQLVRCGSGYQYSVHERRCKDIDECSLRISPCQGHCHNTEGSYYCSCPEGYRRLLDGESCQDIDECATGRARCATGMTCLNTLGSYRCEDLSCPPYYVRTSASQCIRKCPFNNEECANLDDRIQYHFLNKPSGIRQGSDLIQLSVIREADGSVHSNSQFTIIDQREAEEYCNCQVPFAIRNQDNRGIVYTTKPLNRATNYRIKVRAQGYRPNGQLEYQTTFVLFISVSAYTYQ
ncbi:hemicentin-1-like isoform X3 [Apostichopus japonicus]|uniref:hemicentin-1-like isoform X3 n=1 Tax=Stichopus japonicus TaxID=307972 RepID=UPI003AB1DA17